MIVEEAEEDVPRTILVQKSKNHPVVAAVIVQWTFIMYRVGTNTTTKETFIEMKREEEIMVMFINIARALIEATTTTMNIMLMHRSTLNLGILTLLVTHPLLEMIIIVVKNATTLRTTTNALVHLILIMIDIPIKMKDSIDPDVRRPLAGVKVIDVGHLDLPMERRCRCSELLLIP